MTPTQPPACGKISEDNTNVVELDSYRRIPHIVEEQTCCNCGNKQLAVQPDSFEFFARQWWECSKCKKNTCSDIQGIRPRYPHER